MALIKFNSKRPTSLMLQDASGASGDAHDLLVPRERKVKEKRICLDWEINSLMLQNLLPFTCGEGMDGFQSRSSMKQRSSCSNVHISVPSSASLDIRSPRGCSSTQVVLPPAERGGEFSLL